MTRAVVCVATTPHYQQGMKRLGDAVFPRESANFYGYSALSTGWPAHQDNPYAFKAYAIEAQADYADLLLWCDASILPIRSLEPLWEKIERDGYWIARNGWNNYQWTADAAYWELFRPEREQAVAFVDHVARREYGDGYIPTEAATAGELPILRDVNKTIPHVVATSFGINVKHPVGKAFLDEYYRLASETRAFCGPWINSNHPSAAGKHVDGVRVAPCGPPDVLGHRHDQVAASVIAWRLGMVLTDCPDIFAYPNADGSVDPRTILLADGSY